jgi:hypothetical protein
MLEVYGLEFGEFLVFVRLSFSDIDTMTCFRARCNTSRCKGGTIISNCIFDWRFLHMQMINLNHLVVSIQKS